jgi:hypothetical protein
MRLRPVDSAAALALGKAIVTRENVWRHAQDHEFARDRDQKMIALRASRERSRSRIEPETRDDFSQLIAQRLALDEHYVRRGAQPFVASDKYPAFDARDFQELSAAERWVGDDVGAEQAEPSRKPHQHSIDGNSGRFIHRVKL